MDKNALEKVDVLAYFKQRCELDRSINLHYVKVRQYADDKPRYPKETTELVDENALILCGCHSLFQTTLWARP